VVLNEGAGDQFWPVDSELDECKRYPLIASLDDAGFAENDFVRNDVMREAVSFTCHEHLQFLASVVEGWGMTDVSGTCGGEHGPTQRAVVRVVRRVMRALIDGNGEETFVSKLV
jgi:hypothetical protein